MPLATLPVIWRRSAPVAVRGRGDGRHRRHLRPAALRRDGPGRAADPLLARPRAWTGSAGRCCCSPRSSYLAFTDPIISPGALAFFVPTGPACSRSAGSCARASAIAARLEARTRELERERERTAELAVALERDRLAGELDATARARTRRMIALAERGERGAFGEIERLGRESLNEMRELLGALRGDARAPHPTLLPARRPGSARPGSTSRASGARCPTASS